VGNYFEDFTVGMHFRHPLGRTVGAFDNRWFTLLTMNTNQLHFNVHYAEASDHGRELVNSGLSVAIVLGLSVSDISQHAVANLGWTDIRLLHPLFVEDTLYAESIITEVRASRSRPHAGIVGCFTRGLNQRGDVIMTFTRSVMVLRREAASLEAAFPTAPEPIEDALRSRL
jgi:itaconyl-CoA hydratase